MKLENVAQEQKKLLNLLVHFDEFCKKHDVKYFLFAGTELGAVREHGFIAWDGDIDLMMSADEYKRLCEIMKTEKSEHFKWTTYETNKHIPSMFPKIYEPGVDETHLEDFSYIEICPFTGVPDNKFLRELLWKINLRNSQIYWVKNRIYKNDLKRRHNQIGMLLKILLFWWPNSLSKFIFRKSINAKCLQNKKDYTYLTCLYNCKRTAIPASWLEDEPVYMEFEKDYAFPVIKEYHKHLTQMYGDYMTPKRYSRYEN